MKIAFSLPLFIFFSILACKKPVESKSDSVWSTEKPVITKVLLRDTIPVRFLSGLDIKELHGIRASYFSGKYTCYYEYEADQNAILKMISSLPFKRSNHISDTTCQAFYIPFSTRGRSLLSSEELQAANFFWQINPPEFHYYECLKNPTRHTILINKTTGRILHRIESES